MPIYIGQSTTNQKKISLGDTQLQRVYVGNQLVWVKPSDYLVVKYGVLYNVYAAHDIRGITSLGWHLPTKDELSTLMRYLDPDGTTSSNDAGGYLKEIGTTSWNTPNTGASNSAKFNGKGSGARLDLSGAFSLLKQNLRLWGSEISLSSSTAFACSLSYNDSKLNTSYESNIVTFNNVTGASIRPIKDSTTLTHGQSGLYTGNDGKIYRTICIGNQEWVADNLAETKFRTNFKTRFGALYNWYVATDPRNIAASGWHVMTSVEASSFITFLGGISGAAKISDSNIEYWDLINLITHNYKFNARGSGARNNTGAFSGLKQSGRFWVIDGSYSRALVNFASMFNQLYLGNRGTETYKKYGLSIRIIKDSTTLSNGQEGVYVGNDGEIYRTICINGVEYLADNLYETRFRTGELIPIVTDNTAWDALLTAGMCYYDNNINYAVTRTDLIPEVTNNTTWGGMRLDAMCAYNNDWSSV